MLFKLSLKNIKKSFKDYGIYFLTLVLGVAIFYMFNSLDSQQAMLNISNSQRDIIKLMIGLLNYISIFIAVILGLLIVYANNFLINRRKKEFGIYMTLGMSKRQISKIILFETIFIGIISLGVGLIIGIFVSQFMSVLVAKLFEANMTKFEFVFSKDATIKTCIYFTIMYLAVMIFNTITISKYKLINLLTAIKKNETIKLKNPLISILIFIIASFILGYAYWKVTSGSIRLNTLNDILPIILLGIIGTILVFWSLSGFILKIMQLMKKTYLKGTNMFVLRQINNKINTTVISMSVICLMLFMTITILSSGLSLKNTMQKDLIEMTPVDLNIYKIANLPEKYTNRFGEEFIYTQDEIEDSRKTIKETLIQNEFDMNNLKDIIEIPIYSKKDLTMGNILNSIIDEAKEQFPMLAYKTPEEIVKISDYNKIAKMYGTEEYKLEDNEYIILCDFDNMTNLRNKAIQKDSTIIISGKKYISKYNECKDGFIMISTSHINTGIILVPDNCDLKETEKERMLLVANYNVNVEDDKKSIENIFVEDDSDLLQNLKTKGLDLNIVTKKSIIDSSVGLATIVVFIAIYLGVIFLIASSAILALKQLTESSDNKQRYIILRKIGCDEKMINKALFKQVGIFFLFPLILALIHSIFGIKFAFSIMSTLASEEQLLPSVMATMFLIGIIYGLYFLATYYGSKNIIKEE